MTDSRGDKDGERLKLLLKAYTAAVAFIDAHAADPDITEEMVRRYADYQEAKYAWESRK